MLLALFVLSRTLYIVTIFLKLSPLLRGFNGVKKIIVALLFDFLNKKAHNRPGVPIRNCNAKRGFFDLGRHILNEWIIPYGTCFLQSDGESLAREVWGVNERDASDRDQDPPRGYLSDQLQSLTSL